MIETACAGLCQVNQVGFSNDACHVCLIVVRLGFVAVSVLRTSR
jgi:hypothetical protein